MDKKTTIRGPWAQAASRFAANRLALVCLAVLGLILLACICAPLLTPYTYYTMDLENARIVPTKAHILGTDALGRDTLTRLLYGGRITFRITFGAVGLSLFGIVFGLLAGYFGGWVDGLISRTVDALASIPTFLLAILFECILGWGSGNYMYAMAIALMPPLIRLTRNLVMEILGSDYIEAARALGVGGGVILTRHVLRNIAAPIIIHVSSSLAESLLTCTIMGYLNIGVNPPMPEWGLIVREAYTYILSYPYMAAIPCCVIVVCVLCLNIIGNGLRDALAGEGGEG